MFLVDNHPRTTNSSYTKPEWILVSYHQDDVITISASTPPDSDLDNDFSQPPAEEILQLIGNVKYTHARHTTSLTAIQQQCKQYKKASKNHTRATMSPSELTHPRQTYTVIDYNM